MACLCLFTWLGNALHLHSESLNDKEFPFLSIFFIICFYYKQTAKLFQHNFLLFSTNGVSRSTWSKYKRFNGVLQFSHSNWEFVFLSMFSFLDYWQLLGYNEKPVSLQMFIGTADDRHVRPHAFYQVHRITGKTVATPSQEMVIGGTKILEIPLLPENTMSARCLS